MGSSTALQAVHELFVAGRVDSSYLDSAAIRPVVAESWRRSLATGVDPDVEGASASAVTLRTAQLRDTHPLAAALPVIRRLLVDDATDSGVVVAVTAADGTLLWVEGDPEAVRKAEAMNFVPGADWSEHRTSAQTLALVRATAVAVENHLALLRLTDPVATLRRAAGARLRVLGAERPQWHATDDRGRCRSAGLTPRHADILVLLSRHPEGLSVDHLAMLLDDDKDLDVVTIRAEMSRLRRVIAPVPVGSRPYRLLEPVDSDVGRVFDDLRRGRVRSALEHYPGALLPQSTSPAIARVRTELSTSLRAAVIATAEPTTLRRWLDLPEGRDDRDGWRLLYDAAGAGSVGQAQARGHLAGLDLDLA